ncbi:MAG TPA: DUF6249 domain-containing protein [Candidatus Saccharimonadales bacterium]|nr:DUF6249 domain-containing protein [Candidatus Saccharimonadales bacterium]
MTNRLNKFWGISLLLPFVAAPLTAHAQIFGCPVDSTLGLMGLSGAETLIPLVAIGMGCSIPIIIISLQLYFRHEKNKMMHQTIRSMVDKGQPIPPELLNKEHDITDPAPRRGPRNDLRNGLIFIGIGIGVIIMAGKVGWIIFLMGIAFVIASRFEKKETIGQPPKI